MERFGWNIIFFKKGFKYFFKNLPFSYPIQLGRTFCRRERKFPGSLLLLGALRFTCWNPLLLSTQKAFSIFCFCFCFGWYVFFLFILKRGVTTESDDEYGLSILTTVVWVTDVLIQCSDGFLLFFSSYLRLIICSFILVSYMYIKCVCMLICICKI